MKLLTKIILFLSSSFIGIDFVHAQIISKGDTLYGNEWIKYDQTYYKFKVAQDDLYRISYEILTNTNFPMAGVKGSQLQLWRFGKEIPLRVSSSDSWGPGDFLTFWGEKNRTELDSYLFQNPAKEMLNPAYSMFSDSAAYFLTVAPIADKTVRVNTISSNMQLAPSPFFMVDQLAEYHAYPFDKKYDYQNEISYSSYDECEGFGSVSTQSFSLNLTAIDPFAGNADGKLTIRLASILYLNHKIQISINDEVQALDSLFGYQLKVFSLPIPNSLLEHTIKLEIKGIAPGNDLFTVSTIHFEYPKKIGGSLASNEKIISNNSNSLLSFTSELKSPILILNDSDWVLPTSINAGIFFEIGNVNNKFRIADENNKIDIQNLSRINFENITENSQNDYLIITHKTLLTASVSYAEYRKSKAGGNFSTKVVPVEQIYDQFGYGMDQVIGLRNYGQYLSKYWSNLKYVLLIGRALNYRDLRVDKNYTKYAHLNLVPTFGYPGADNLIFARPGENVPVFLIGRLAAQNSDQVVTYLTKVKEYESKLKSPTSNDDLYWRKNVLHMAGGNQTDQRFDLALESLKNLFESTSLKPIITSVNKTSSDPIQGGLSEIITNKINEGVAIQTYLGHGAVNATELGLDNPDLFNNDGKYPICMTLGCNSGNIHTTGISLSESFIFSKKGDIIYLSSSGIGTDGGYIKYVSGLYPRIGNTMYDKSIGEQHYSTLKDFQNSGNSFFDISLSQQFAIHGDPAIHINYYEGPDFTVDYKSFKTIPEVLQADQDSLKISFTLWNLGKFTAEKIPFTLTHQLPDGISIDYPFTTTFTGSTKEVVLSIPSNPNIIGNNIFRIKIDPDNVFNEYPQPFAENNNELIINGQTGIVIPIFNDKITVSLPTEFGIIGTSPFELKAFTPNAFSGPTKFFFEIDTTINFNSTFLFKATSIQRGGMITWKPTITSVPSKVYYWRIRRDTIDTGKSANWTTNSFVYLPEKGTGWNQSHKYQFAANPQHTLNYEIPSNQWKMDGSVSIVVKSIDQSIDLAEYSKILINGGRVSRNNKNHDAEFIIGVYDKMIGDFLFNGVDGRDGAINAFGRPVQVFSFPMEDNLISQRANLIRFIETGVKPGQYVIIYNFKNPGKSYFPEEWARDSISLGKNVFSVLESRGAKKIRQLQEFDSYPYLLAYQEGGAVIDEVISSDGGLTAISSFELPKQLSVGNASSTIIGPALRWKKFEWETNDKRDKALNEFTIYGINNQGETELIKTSDPSFDLSAISAAQYPYMRLAWKASDTLLTGSLNLSYWRIYFDKQVDLAIQANDAFDFYKDTIDQNDIVSLKYSIINSSDQACDSLLVVYSIQDNNNKIESDSIKYFNLGPLEKLNLRKEITTTQREKHQSLTVDIKILDVNKLEYTLKNNTGKINFYVIKDIIPPTFNVFFDGKQIVNNDLVSRQPSIEIDVKDNKILAGGDSQAIDISIKYPNTNQYIKLSAQEYSITYSNKEAHIKLSPILDKNGIYSLRVQVKDKSGNTAALEPFEISFKRIIENSISTVLPYPNPFTTQCQFAYTITGSRPSVFKIQIMTINGRIVKELTESDLGFIEEGTHLTERTWNGTDEYGNKLATGTYLYRVVAKDLSGKEYQSFEDLDNNAGFDNRKFFKKGVGKLVILR